MTTIQELRIIVEDIKNKTAELVKASNELNSFVNRVSSLISESNPFASTIDIDELITLETPLYNALLTRVQNSVTAL